VSDTEPGPDARALARLRNRSAFERQVAGSLRSTIAAHGPIGEREIGSASKRVASQVYAWLREEVDHP
jgi:hypothetical protein